VFGDAPFTVNATASSGLPVSFSIVSGPATISGNTVTITGAGLITVRASQAGDATYNAAVPVDRSFTVAKANQTITFNPLANKTFGSAPFNIFTTSSSGLTVSLSIVSGPATVSGTTVTLTGAGIVTVRASQAGNSNYNAAASIDRSFTVDKASQTIIFGPLADKSFGDAAFSVNASASSGLPVSFSIVSGPANLSGNTVTITGVGLVTVRASQAGDSNNNAAASVDQSFTVAKANQTITFNSPGTRTFGDAPFNLSATASSGLLVGFSIVSGPATISGATVTLTGAGVVTARAFQTGNANYNAAASVDRAFTVDKTSQTITFGVLPDKNFGDAAFPVNAASSSGLPVSFSILSGPASISGNTITITGAGLVTVRASQSGDANNNAALPVDRSFNVAKANQTITFDPLANKIFGDGPFNLVAAASSGLPVSFSIVSGPATILGSTLTVTGAGVVTVRASQTGDTNYNAGASVDRAFTAAKASQTVTFNALSDKSFADAPFGLSATSSSGLPVIFSILSGPASISGNTLSITATGVVSVRASQPGDANFNAAVPVDQSFTVSKASQLITFNTPANKIFGDAPFNLVASSSSGLPVTFGIVSGPATLSNDTITLTDVGVVTVRASQAGNANYNAATSVDRSFNVNIGTFESAGLTTDQAEIKTWTVQGTTYVYVKLLFPNAGYRVNNWGQASRIGNDFTADAAVEKFTGASVQALTTTAQIYDLGPLANGIYNFNFNTSGTLTRTLQFTLSSIVPPPNPIDNAREFVRQQYRDFLNREADQAGEDFWTDNIAKCSDPARRPAGQTEAQCTLRQRETTSGAFFLSPEFQYTGYYVYRMYQGALGRQPKLSEFITDTQFVANGIVVNGQLSAAVINQNKAAFAAQFANCTDATKSRCAEFKARYDGLNNTQYVDKLFQTTGVNASATNRVDLVNSIGANQTRATVLQKVVDGINVISEGNQQFTTTYGQAFYDQQFNRAFVLLEYFGYMRRDPDDAGYNFWLAKLDQFGGNFVNAEMVLAFISSPEYRARFGQP
jgi:DnaJ-class molecular chaperone